jgi:ribosomal protein S27E
MPFQFYCPQGHLLEGHESQMGQQSQCPMCGSVFVMPVMPGATMPSAPVPGGPVQPGGWPGYGQPAPPGYSQPAAYGQQMPPGYPMNYPPGSVPPNQFPGYPGGYGPPGGPMPGYGQPQGVYGQPQVEQVFTGAPFSPAGQPPEAGAQQAASAGFPAIQTEPPPEPTASTTAPEQPAAAPAEAAAPQPEEKKEPRIVRIPCPQGHELQTPMDMVNQEVLCPICGAQFHLRYEDSIEFKEEQAELRRRKAESLNYAAMKWSIVAAVVIVLVILGMIVYMAVRHARHDENYTAPEPEPAAEEPAEKSEPAPEEKAPATATSPSAEPQSSTDGEEQ